MLEKSRIGSRHEQSRYFRLSSRTEVPMSTEGAQWTRRNNFAEEHPSPCLEVRGQLWTHAKEQGLRP